MIKKKNNVEQAFSRKSVLPFARPMVLIFAIFAICEVRSFADNGVIFRIGKPDGYAKEFKRVHVNHPKALAHMSSELRTFILSLKQNENDYEYIVGKNKSEDWPFIQYNKVKNYWVGKTLKKGLSIPYKITFNLDVVPNETQYFKIGIIDSLRTDWQIKPEHYPTIQVSINDFNLKEKRVNVSSGGIIVYHQEEWGNSEMFIWKIPPDLLKKGKNTFTISMKNFTTHSTSYIVYDFLSLENNDKLPLIPNRILKMKKDILDGTMKDINEIVFALRTSKNQFSGHFYQTFYGQDGGGTVNYVNIILEQMN